MLLLPLFTFLSISSLETNSISAKDNAEKCSQSGDQAETIPAKVDLSEVLSDIKALKTKDGGVFIDSVQPELEKSIRKLFEADPKKISKLEQFYGLLFFLAKHKTIKSNDLSFEPKSVIKLLLSSKVFSNEDFPRLISAVHLQYNSQKERAAYEVKFAKDEVRLPLNAGKGFSSFKENLCQTAKELIFYGGFSFEVGLTLKNSHVNVSKFKNVDLFGRFGSRGVVNVDIQYVSLRSVEFLTGSPMGIVTAKVSKREFDENDHSFLLRLVSSLVTDRSTQAIDW